MSFVWVPQVTLLLISACLGGWLAWRVLRRKPVARQTIVKWLPDAIIVVDMSGRIIDLNPAACALGAVREEEAIGRPPAEVFGQLAESMEQACRGDVKQFFEQTIRLKDTDPADALISRSTDERTLQLVARPLCDRMGRTSGRLLILRDTTAQVETESALSRHNTVLAMLRVIDRDILAAIDLDERLQVVVEGLLTVFNAALARVWLLEGDELVLRASAGLSTHVNDEFRRVSLEAESFLSRVVEQGACLTDAASSDPPTRYPKWAQDEGLVAFAAYPLLVAGEVIGVLVLFARYAISEDDFALLGDFANQVAISVHSAQLFGAARERAQRQEEIAAENARLYRETRRKADELAALLEVGREISVALDLPHVLELIAARAKEILNVDDSNVYLLDPASQTLRAVVALGSYSDEIKATALKLGEGIVGRVAADGASEMVNRVDLDPRSVQIPGTPVEPESLLCAPLLSKGQVIGVLVLSRLGEREFVQSDLDFLDSLARQASIAIENAQLVEAERVARIRADALRQVARAAGSTLDINEVLKRILLRLKRVLTYDMASVLIFRKGDSSPIAITAYEDEARVHKARLRLTDSPLLKQIARERRPIVIADVQTDDRWILIEGTEHVRTWLGVPLLVRDEMIGALMVESTQTGFYTWEDATLTASVAQQAAIAIENARLFEDARRRVAELSILFDASQAITTTLDRDALFALIAEKMGQAIHATSAYVCDIDEAAGATTVIGEYTGPDASPAERAPDLGTTYPLWDASRVLESVRSNKPLTYMRRDLSSNDPERTHMEEFGGNTILIIPLHIHGETIGYAELWDSREERVFSPSEIRLCQTIAHQAVLAYKNVQLYQSAQERAETLAALHEIDMDISSELEIGRLLDKVIRRATELLGGKSGSIWLYDEQANLLRCEVSLAGWRDFTGNILHPGQGVNGRVFQTGQPLAVDDYSTWAGAAESYTGDPIGPTVGVPLIWKGQVRGVLNLVGQLGDSPFSQAEIATLSLFAGQTTIALENARLFDELHRRANELAAVNIRLQELDQIKDQFIQNVSHELRTPLALIRGHAEALESGMLGELLDEPLQSVAVIARRSRILSALVEDITTLLEVEARVTPMSPTSLPEIIRDVLDDFQALAAGNRLTLRAEIAPDLPLLMGQARHLYKVFDNLIDNAIKFTPPSGTITVRLFQEGDLITFQVSDTGIGIPSDKQERVFDRFYQADGTARRRYGGTGLGLALVKEIVQAHGGQVTLESDPEHGSTFTISIPVSESVQDSQPLEMDD